MKSIKTLVASLLAVGALSTPAGANGVNNGGIPPYVDYFSKLIPHHPFIQADAKPGQAVKYLMESLSYWEHPDEPMPTVYEGVATLEVRVVALERGIMTLDTVVSSGWNKAETFTLRQRLQWPSRTIISEEYCGIEGEPGCRPGNSPVYMPDFYKAARLNTAGFGELGTPYTLVKRGPEPLLTAAGVFPTEAATYYALQVAERPLRHHAEVANDAGWQHTLKIWTAADLPVLQVVKIIWAHKWSDTRNGTYQGTMSLKLIGLTR